MTAYPPAAGAIQVETLHTVAPLSLSRRTKHLKRKKSISILILIFFGIWFFQYFLSYVPGAFTIGVLLIGLSLWIVILGIALYQIIKLALEKSKYYQRLIYVAVIFILNFISLAKPMGLIDWEKYEGENLLIADREGTANCRTILKLKPKNKFKYISRCFGVDFHMGTYKFANDTLHLQLKRDVDYMDESSFATLVKSENDSTKYIRLILHENYESKRKLSYLIREIEIEKLLNEE